MAAIARPRQDHIAAAGFDIDPVRDLVGAIAVGDVGEIKVMLAAGRRRSAQCGGGRRYRLLGQRPLAVASLLDVEIDHCHRRRQRQCDLGCGIFREPGPNSRLVDRPVIEAMPDERRLVRLAREHVRAGTRIGERGVERCLLDAIGKGDNIGNGGGRRIKPCWRLAPRAGRAFSTALPFLVEIGRGLGRVAVRARAHGRTHGVRGCVLTGFCIYLKPVIIGGCSSIVR